MSRESFWQFQLGPGADLCCRRWSRPRVLLPVHGLQDEYDDGKRELARLGRVLDYDVPGPLTADARNFDDPQHFNVAVARVLARRGRGVGRIDERTLTGTDGCEVGGVDSGRSA
jgi:hypothetical protein